MARHTTGAVARAVLALALVMSAAAGAAAEPVEPAGGCGIVHNADDPMTALIEREKFADSYFKALCPWLATNGLELNISSDSGLIDGQPFAWVSVRVLRTRTQVTGPRAAQSTVLPKRSEPPETGLREALDSSLTALTDDRPQHLAELAKREAMAATGH
jgi:hypothetical protein